MPGVWYIGKWLGRKGGQELVKEDWEAVFFLTTWEVVVLGKSWSSSAAGIHYRSLALIYRASWPLHCALNILLVFDRSHHSLHCPFLLGREGGAIRFASHPVDLLNRGLSQMSRMNRPFSNTCSHHHRRPPYDFQIFVRVFEQLYKVFDHSMLSCE